MGSVLPSASPSGRNRRPAAAWLCAALSLVVAWPRPAATAGTRPAAKPTVETIAQGTAWETPCYIQDSGAAGPTVVISGGMHGNEPAGAYAAEEIRHWPITRGKIIVLPRANAAALRAVTRESPGAEKGLGNLNRNFPRAGKAEPPRGTPAAEIWQLVRKLKPDWLVDLHESLDARQPGNKKVGNTAIVFPTAQGREAASLMLEAVNATIPADEPKFVRVGPPVDGSVARGAGEHLGAHAMILETTKRDQPLSRRVRHHRIMVHRLLVHLKMLDASVSVHWLTARGPQGRRASSPLQAGPVQVALYDSAGAAGRGIPRLLALLGGRDDAAVLPIGPLEIDDGALSQFDVLIVPGGSGSSQARAVGKAGREKMREFVRQGGGYIGICAGAYLATSGFSWGLGILDANTVSPKWRRGTGTIQIELTPQGRAILGDLRGRTDCRYANGPILQPAGVAEVPDYVTLALFRTELAENDTPKGVMVDSPAIVAGQYGKGRVICSSPHPEQSQELAALVLRAVAWVAGREPARMLPTTRKASAATAEVPGR